MDVLCGNSAHQGTAVFKNEMRFINIFKEVYWPEFPKPFGHTQLEIYHHNKIEYWNMTAHH